MKRAVVLLLPLIVGCSATAQTDREEARFQSFNGMTVSQFMAETLITPTDHYESNGQRIFIANKVAPDPRFGCRIHLETVSNGRKGPDGWTIVRTRREGGCAFV